MGKFFFYTREATENKKDENGQPIPLKNDKGEVVPGKFETQKVNRTDSFQISKVIRTHAVADDQVIVLLDDGHEVTEKVPTLKNPKLPPAPANIIEVKERQWVQSEILVKGTDVEALFEALKAA